MREINYSCGPCIESTCEPYLHEGRKACSACNAAIPGFVDYDDFIVDEFVNNLKRCEGCAGNTEEGCAICGQWATYANPSSYPEYAKAQELFALSKKTKANIVFEVIDWDDYAYDELADEDGILPLFECIDYNIYYTSEEEKDSEIAHVVELYKQTQEFEYAARWVMHEPQEVRNEF